MTEELQNKIYQAYPALYRQKDLTERETCMCWGICVGDGWYAIIDYVSKALTRIAEEYDVVIEAAQVKEKFGTLRFYDDVKLGKSWKYKPTLLCRLLNWFKNQRKLWKLINHSQCPLWIYRAITKQNYAGYTYKGKTKLEAVRHSWHTGIGKNAYAVVMEQISDAINIGELMSGLICEKCGTSINVSTGGTGWITTLCDNCRSKKANNDTTA